MLTEALPLPVSPVPILPPAELRELADVLEAVVADWQLELSERQQLLALLVLELGR